MKAERRHELKENSLIRGIRNLPEFWRLHGSKLALGVILILLAMVLVRMWINNRLLAKQAVAEQLTSARSLLESFRRGETGETQTVVWSRVEGAVTEVLKNSTDPAQLGEATLLRGDANLHWALLATIGDPPEATTQPSLRISANLAKYLDDAKKNYNDVVNQKANLPSATYFAARIGLAAVAEDRREFGEARTIYESIQKEATDETVKRLAEIRLRVMSQIDSNPLIGPPKAPEKPATQATPTTAASTAPATVPTTAPMTAPAASTTQPSMTAPTTAPSVPATQPTTKP